MGSKLVIGCRQCEQKFKSAFYFIEEKVYQFPVLFLRKYRENELGILFREQHQCPFCKEKLVFTPKLERFVGGMINKPFHTEVVDNAILRFSTGKIAITFSINCLHYKMQTEKLYETFENTGDYVPSSKEIKNTLDALMEFDPEKWNFRIESGFAAAPFSSIEEFESSNLFCNP